MYASNLNHYTLHNLPVDFWNQWRSDKEEMKKDGYSPFKTNKGWFLALYDGKKATRSEYKKWQKEEATKLADAIMNNRDNPESKDEDDFYDQLYSANNTSEVIDVCKQYSDLFYDIDTIIQTAKDNVFNSELEPLNINEFEDYQVEALNQVNEMIKTYSK